MKRIVKSRLSGLTLSIGAAAAPALASAGVALAQEANPPTARQAMAGLRDSCVDLDTVWVLVTGFLVFCMQAGFRPGRDRAYGRQQLRQHLHEESPRLLLRYGGVLGRRLCSDVRQRQQMVRHERLLPVRRETFGSLAWTPVDLHAKFIFRLVFAGTAATVVSGAMAERPSLVCYMIYSAVISLVICPVAGHWIWGGGLRSPGNLFGGGAGMFGFAGSTVVHSVGGWLALCGAIVVGPRLGKYGPDGKVRATPGHSFPLMILGVFILWLGWFGFNPGSTMMATGRSLAIAHVAVTTNMAAATGAVGALLTSHIWFGQWDGSMAGNGCLAALVAITASCAFVGTGSAALIGLIAGVLAVVSVVFFDRVARIDDPVGVISVRLVSGAWRTLALGLFSNPAYGPAGPLRGLFFGGGLAQLKMQAVGAGVAGLSVGQGLTQMRRRAAAKHGRWPGRNDHDGRGLPGPREGAREHTRKGRT